MLYWRIDISLDKKYIRLDSNYHKMLRGAQVQRYYITDDISQGDILFLDSEQYLSEVSSPKSQHHSVPRIVMQGITGVNEKYRLKMTLSKAGCFCANSVNYLLLDDHIEYFLGICNSKLMNWFFKKLSTNSNVNRYEIDNLPIIVASEETIRNITEKVTCILNGNSNNQADLEKQIDSEIYQIYSLSPEEIAVVEN